ncbi:MAG: SGNH/GDSL hydrolase family protein [Actinomycetota bacterium]|nr:SGNH/GDSL hydrolase family protein [Actinomycetota bacterium]
MGLFRSTRLLAAVLAVVAAVGVTAPPAGATVQQPYVALGDSYTAGPLIPIQLPDPLGCGRSDHNYPHVVARSRGAVLHDVSCSGATTEDLFSPQQVFGGPNPAQLDALDGAVQVVTIQIGGNDIGFSEILQRCAAAFPVGTPCQDAYVHGGVDELSRRIADTGPKVAAALTEARRRAPNARAFVVGYPAILPEAYPGCWPVMPFAPADVPYLRGVEKELNAMLAARAAAAGDSYVDLYTPSTGHDACQLPLVRWVEPVIPLSLAAPVHPNLFGMQAMAGVVGAAIAA